jgi:hypothetical protein
MELMNFEELKKYLFEKYPKKYKESTVKYLIIRPEPIKYDIWVKDFEYEIPILRYSNTLDKFINFDKIKESLM